MDRRAWLATVQRVEKSQTGLSMHTHTNYTVGSNILKKIFLCKWNTYFVTFLLSKLQYSQLTVCTYYLQFFFSNFEICHHPKIVF